MAQTSLRSRCRPRRRPTPAIACVGQAPDGEVATLANQPEWAAAIQEPWQPLDMCQLGLLRPGSACLGLAPDLCIS